MRAVILAVGLLAAPLAAAGYYDFDERDPAMDNAVSALQPPYHDDYEVLRAKLNGSVCIPKPRLTPLTIAIVATIGFGGAGLIGLLIGRRSKK